MNPHHSPDDPGRATLRFRAFRLDRKAGCLTRAGQPVPLRPKTWAVLSYLAERRGVLVTVDELMDAVWPDVAVTPSTLTKSIVELRAALEDDARNPSWIETVHRRGFRFLAELSDDPVTDVVCPFWPEHGEPRSIFVGREAELRRLHESFLRAGAGERQTTLLAGPAGIGKTALVTAFLESVSRQAGSAVRIAWGACVGQFGIREAYMPLLDALEGLTRHPDAESCVGLLHRIAPTWWVQMPWLAAQDGEAMRRALGLARPERMLRELGNLLDALAADVPLVLVLEDLHWSDPATIDALSFLAQRRQPARLLMIATYRPTKDGGEEHPLHAAVSTLRARRACTELRLGDLSESDVEKYLQARFPGADFASVLARKVYRYTDGSPLFTVSVVENELLRGRIMETDPGWALAIPPEDLRLEVSEDVRGVLEGDLESLAPGDLDVLRAASVVEGEFAVQTVASVLGVDVQDTEARCAALARAHRFLRPLGPGHWPDGTPVELYEFAHELYRNAVYGGIPAGRRRVLHQRTGESLEAAYRDHVAEIAAVLAVHFEQSGDAERVVRYLASAAALARRRFANREAIRILEDALAWVARLPVEADRLRRELELRLALAPALNEVYGFAGEPVCENGERAHALCAEVGGRDEAFQVLYSLIHVYWLRGDRVRGPQAVAELDELATRLGTMEHRLIADTMLVRTLFHRGRFAEVQRLAADRLPASEASPLHFFYGTHPVVAARCHAALADWMLGRPESARESIRAELATARAMGIPSTLIAALWFASFLEVLSRRPRDAEPLVEEALSLCALHGTLYWEAVASSLKGWVLDATGRTREGIETLRRAYDSLRAQRSNLVLTHTLAFAADSHLRLGEVEAGLVWVDEALQVAESTLDGSHEAELWRIRGELLLVSQGASSPQGSPMAATADTRESEGERCLLRALAVSRQAEARSLELRAATSLARFWQRGDRRAEGRAVLADVLAWFGPNAESADLTEARALLASL